MLSHSFIKEQELLLLSIDGTYQEFNSIRQCAKHLEISDNEAYKLMHPGKNINNHVLIEKSEVADYDGREAQINPEK